MKRVIFGLAACAAVGLCPLLRADEAAKQAKGDPTKELAAIQKDWSDAQDAFGKALQQAKSTEERQQVVKDKRPKAAEFADRFLKLAETYPDSPEAIQALGWIVGNAGGTDAAGKAMPQLKEKLTAMTDLDKLHQCLMGLPAYNLSPLAPVVAEKAKKNLDNAKAVPLLMWVCSATLYSSGKPELSELYNGTVDFLMDRYVERPELAPLATWLPMDDHPDWAEKHLRRLMDKNPSDDVKHNAKFGLASVLERKDEASQPEAEKLFQSLIDESGDSPAKKQLTDKAKDELAEMKVRGIGKPAPDIAGDDLDAKAFKLSDYKGKVVLLDFWGFW